MTDLQNTAPEYLFHDTNWEEGDPDFREMNTKGEFLLAELHKVTPAYLLEEFVTMPDGSVITEPDCVKYLGIHFDNHMNFSKHIDIVSSKISRVIGPLWKSDHLNMKAKRAIYSGLVESHLSYGILVWAATPSRNLTTNLGIDHTPSSLKAIATAQNKIVRAIVRKPKYNKNEGTYTCTSKLYKDLGFLKLNDLYYFNLALLAHKFVHHKSDLPTSIRDKFKLKADVTVLSSRTRTCNLDLYYELPNNLGTYRKPTLAAAIYWNKLPIDLKSTESYNSFKKKLKNLLIERY